MKRKAVRQILAAMMMIILLLPGSVSAEAAGSDPSRAGELHVPLAEMDTNGKMISAASWATPQAAARMAYLSASPKIYCM